MLVIIYATDIIRLTSGTFKIITISRGTVYFHYHEPKLTERILDSEKMNVGKSGKY